VLLQIVTVALGSPLGREVLGWTAPNGIAMCQGDVVVGHT